MCDCLLSGLKFSAGCVGGGGVILVRQDDKNTWEFVTIFIANLTRSIITIFLVLVLVISPIRPEFQSRLLQPGFDSVPHVRSLSPFTVNAWWFPLRGFLPPLQGFKIVLILIETVS